MGFHSRRSGVAMAIYIFLFAIDNEFVDSKLMDVVVC